jgi:hypothetical protein
MKTKLFLSAIIILTLSCNRAATKKNISEDNAAVKEDSIEYKITYTFTHPDPPYADYDTILIVKFADENDFNAWKAKNNNGAFKSAEQIKK